MVAKRSLVLAQVLERQVRVLPQAGQFPLDRLPDDVVVDDRVPMDQDVAQPDRVTAFGITAATSGAACES